MSQATDRITEIGGALDQEGATAIGKSALRSIGGIARNQRLKDNDESNLAAHAILASLHDDNLELAAYLRATHALLCGTTRCRHYQFDCGLDRPNRTPLLVYD